MCENNFKKCNLCGEVKSIDNFYKKTKSKEGIQIYQPYCKECFYIIYNEYKEKDKLAFLIRQRQYNKKHINNNLREGMSWENYGKWEIDHIKPLTAFDETALPSEVNALSNLQPLWKEENRIKENKYCK
jgi:hypothetical protein